MSKNNSKNINKKKDTTLDSNKDSINRISSSEKEELLNFGELQQGISKFNLFLAFGILALILSVLLPKIYLANKIYYVSRDISRLSNEQSLLNEEYAKLNKEIEKVNNKHLLLELEKKY